MKKKAEKIEQGKGLKLELASVSTVILSTFQGITVEQDSKMRREVEAAGGTYQVLKNRVAQHAMEGTPTGDLLKNLKGTNSIAYTKTDPVALAKPWAHTFSFKRSREWTLLEFICAENDRNPVDANGNTGFKEE